MAMCMYIPVCSFITLRCTCTIIVRVLEVGVAIRVDAIVRGKVNGKYCRTAELTFPGVYVQQHNILHNAAQKNMHINSYLHLY